MIHVAQSGAEALTSQEQESQARLLKILQLLAEHTQHMEEPMSITLRQQFGPDPFIILISCLLSLRAKDSMTLPVSQHLFSRVRTPQELLALPVSTLETILYSLGYYRQKTRIIREVAQQLLQKFNGQVPATYAELRHIKHVGPKTANLVLAVAFDIPAICVDVHVHRIANRLGVITTKTPEQTEQALRRLLPIEWWTRVNHLLVKLGQNICVPVSPRCSSCPVAMLCQKIGVTRHR